MAELENGRPRRPSKAGGASRELLGEGRETLSGGRGGRSGRGRRGYYCANYTHTCVCEQTKERGEHPISLRLSPLPLRYICTYVSWLSLTASTARSLTSPFKRENERALHFALGRRQIFRWFPWRRRRRVTIEAPSSQSSLPSLKRRLRCRQEEEEGKSFQWKRGEIATPAGIVDGWRRRRRKL
jgi:hypothetical protein